MRHSEWGRVIAAAMGPAAEYLDSLPTRPVYRPVQDQNEIRAIVGGPLPEHGTAPEDVVASLARDVEPYITAHASGRFFGFVIGGLHPAAYGAELLTATWDQNAAEPVFNYINHKFTMAGATPGSRVQPEVPYSVHRLVFAAAMMRVDRRQEATLRDALAGLGIDVEPA